MTTVNTAGRVTLPVTANTDDGSASVAYRSVTEGFFESLGVPLLAGRSFQRSDVRPSPDIVVVNEAFAERFFPTGEVIGHSLGLAALGIERAQIIGVVGNVRRRGPERSIYPVIYAPILHAPSYGYAVRLEHPTSVPVDALRRVVTALDPTQPIANVRTFESAAERWLGRPQLNSWLMTLFAGLALTVSAFGLLALLLFTTSSRRREIGLRIALGARRDDVLRLVIGDGGRLVAAGVVLGLLAALGLGRLLSGLLFGIAPSDPISLALASTATLVVALPAMWIPAHRATKVDPMTALRLE